MEKSENGKNWRTVLTPESSRMTKISYFEQNQTLKITFRGKNGRPDASYLYFRVPVEVFEDLSKAESKGKFFDSQINGIFDYSKQY